MPKVAYLIHSVRRLPDGTWPRVLLWFSDQADRFTVLFLPDESFSADKDAFLSLPEALLSPSEDAPDCEAISGPVTTAFRDLLLSGLENPESPPLWSLTLSRRGDVLLRLEDFTVCLLFVSAEEIEQLHQLGVPRAAVEQVDLAPQLGPDEQVVPLTQEDVEDLRARLLDPDDEPDQEKHRRGR